MLSSVGLERKLLAWPGITTSLGKVVCLESVLFVCLAARALFIRMIKVCGWMQAKCADVHLVLHITLPCCLSVCGQVEKCLLTAC